MARPLGRVKIGAATRWRCRRQRQAPKRKRLQEVSRLPALLPGPVHEAIGVFNEAVLLVEAKGVAGGQDAFEAGQLGVQADGFHEPLAQAAAAPGGVHDDVAEPEHGGPVGDHAGVGHQRPAGAVRADEVGDGLLQGCLDGGQAALRRPVALRQQALHFGGGGWTTEAGVFDGGVAAQRQLQGMAELVDIVPLHGQGRIEAQQAEGVGEADEVAARHQLAVQLRGRGDGLGAVRRGWGKGQDVHQAAAADGGGQAAALNQGSEPLSEIGAGRLAALHQLVALQDGDNRARQAATQGVIQVGLDVAESAAGELGGPARLEEHAADGVAVAESLAQGDEIRLQRGAGEGRFMLEAEPTAGAPQAGGDFIDHDQAAGGPDAGRQVADQLAGREEGRAAGIAGFVDEATQVLEACTVQALATEDGAGATGLVVLAVQAGRQVQVQPALLGARQAQF